MNARACVACVMVVACSKPTDRAAPDTSRAKPVASTVAAVPDAEAVPEAAKMASLDAGDPDACAPNDTWTAIVEITESGHAQRTVDVVVPRMGVRKTIYGACAIAGGGCSGCARSRTDGPGCRYRAESDRGVQVYVGTDEGEITLAVAQAGDAIVATETTRRNTGRNRKDDVGFDISHAFRGAQLGEGSVSSQTVVRLPCPVKVRFTTHV